MQFVQLNAVLAEQKEAPEIVSMLSICLLRILDAKKASALKAFNAVDLLITIAKSITSQQQLEDVLQVSLQALFRNCQYCLPLNF